MSNNKTIIYIILIVAMALSVAVGCSEGGSSGGRQVLPGENPFGPDYGQRPPGSDTGPGTGTDSETGSGTSTQQTPEELIATGYSKIDEDSYEQAIQAFEIVTRDNKATPAEKQEAHNGLGWAKSKRFGTLTGLDDFYSAMLISSNSDPTILNEAYLGYAIALIYQVVDGTDTANDARNLDTAIRLLEDLLGKSSWIGEVIRPEYVKLFVSSAEARAMLALAYDFSGDENSADYHIGSAVGEEPGNVNIQKAKETIDILRGNL